MKRQRDGGAKGKNPITQMNAKELSEETAEFDREFAADSFQPLDAAARKRWQRAKRKPGRPRRSARASKLSP